jgi:hypothetical protein
LTLRGANSSSLLVSPSITCGRELERAERERESSDRKGKGEREKSSAQDRRTVGEVDALY